MPNASLSRWTLAYFGAALGALVIALGLMSAGFGYPGDGLMAPPTLIVVHLVTIGWLSLLVLGALLQFLPVLVGGTLAGAGWAPVALGLIGSGLALLVAGFGAADGWPLPVEILPLGGLVLLCGIVVAVSILFVTLLRAETIPLPAGFVALALMSVVVTALLGETLASAVSGLFGGDFAMAVVTHGVTLHIGFGLGGWLTIAAMGVSYRLLPMFLVAPERHGFWPRMVFSAAAVALACLCMALGVLLATNAPLPLIPIVAGAAGMVAVSAYLGDIVAFYRSRRRRAVELHMAGAVTAFAALLCGVVLLALALATGSEGALAGTIYILGLGWLGGLGLPMLYKIIPFLTWLECYAPLMGRKPTPRVQDLVRESHARLWFGLYYLALALGASMLALEQAQLFRLAAGLQLLATLFLIQQFYRARRLHDLPPGWRDASRPLLLLPKQRSFL